MVGPRMSQATFVTKVPRARFAALRAQVSSGPFEFRTVPHAEFSVRGEGVIVGNPARSISTPQMTTLRSRFSRSASSRPSPDWSSRALAARSTSWTPRVSICFRPSTTASTMISARRTSTIR